MDSDGSSWRLVCAQIETIGVYWRLVRIRHRIDGEVHMECSLAQPNFTTVIFKLFCTGIYYVPIVDCAT